MAEKIEVLCSVFTAGGHSLVYMNTSSIQLLKEYAETGDQQAFATLVERHINVAYSAAMAALGNDDQAHDACQLTFLELAKKAGNLSPNIHLSGWVYTTARNFSRTIRRSEIRRLNREKRYADDMKMQQLHEPDWSRLSPEIHTAIEKLNTADREAVILRYFQQKNLAEVGAALGISADAARMRLNRALERLNRQLVRGGIASSASAVAAALPSHALATAPEGMASTISTSVLANAGTAVTGTSTGAIIAIMKAKIVIISAVTAAGVITGAGIYLATQGEEASIEPRAVAMDQSGEEKNEDVNLPVVEAAVETVAINEAPVESSEDQELLEEGEISLLSNQQSLQIDDAYIERAEQMMAMGEMMLKMMGSDLMHSQLTRGIEDPSRKLSLRLGLDVETTALFEKAFDDYTESEKERVIKAADDMVETMSGLMENDREGLVNFMALQSMKGAGETLSEEQEAYYAEFEKLVGPNMGWDNMAPQPWHESEELMTSFDDILSEDQHAGLEHYVEEREVRRQEQAAYSRANRLSNRLGLDEMDRAELYDYLYKNPDATNDEIAENLSPELRELMPK